MENKLQQTSGGRVTQVGIAVKFAFRELPAGDLMERMQ